MGFCLIFPQAAVCGTEGYCGCRGCLSISHAPGCGGWVSGWVGDAIHVEGWVDWGCHVCGGVRVPLWGCMLWYKGEAWGARDGCPSFRLHGLIRERWRGCKGKFPPPPKKKKKKRGGGEYSESTMSYYFGHWLCIFYQSQEDLGVGGGGWGAPYLWGFTPDFAIILENLCGRAVKYESWHSNFLCSISSHMFHNNPLPHPVLEWKMYCLWYLLNI